MANRSAAHTALVKAILGYLRLRRIPSWGSKTSGQYDPTTGRYRRFTGLPGVADITGILPGGIALFVEAKTGKGKLTEAQREFRDMVTRAEAVYIEARNLDDVQDVLT